MTELIPSILIVGVGGAGNHIVTRLCDNGLFDNVQALGTLGIDTNVQNLNNTTCDTKLAIGKKVCKGLGAGKDPKRGKAAAKESITEIRNHIQADIAFLIVGLGGGTGTGAAPIISQIAKNKGILTVCISTLPFDVEGKRRMDFALAALEEIMTVTDAIIVIPNEKLLKVAPNSSLEEAFRLADDLAINGVLAIVELVATPGRINVDLADLRALFSLSKKPTGISIIWRGVSEEENREKRITEAVKTAMEFPFIDVDLSHARGVIVNITGSPDLTLKEAQEIAQYVVNELDENVQVIWGHIIDEKLTDTVKVTTVISAVEIDLTNFIE
ncbi:MAG: cell division protein FtsZ [Promethearchaeota archaeon]